jgi:hypothetical protein
MYAALSHQVMHRRCTPHQVIRDRGRTRWDDEHLVLDHVEGLHKAGKARNSQKRLTSQKPGADARMNSQNLNPDHEDLVLDHVERLHRGDTHATVRNG